MCVHAWRTQLNVPFRWTASTASHSSSLMLKIMRSRRIPAQVTRTSILPKRSCAIPVRDRLRACDGLAAAGLDLPHDVERRTRGRGTSVDGDPVVVHHDLR